MHARTKRRPVAPVKSLAGPLAPVNGRLLVYDATDFGTFGDGSKRLQVLWDSQDWNIQFSFNKFNRPVVFNGKLIVPTYDDRVDVYGLA